MSRLQGHEVQVPSKLRYQIPNQIAFAFHSFSTLFPHTWAGNATVYSMKCMFRATEKLSLMVALINKGGRSGDFSSWSLQARLAGLHGYYNRNRALLVSCPSMFVFFSLIGKGLPLRFSTSSFFVSIIIGKKNKYAYYSPQGVCLNIRERTLTIEVYCNVGWTYL